MSLLNINMLIIHNVFRWCISYNSFIKLPGNQRDDIVYPGQAMRYANHVTRFLFIFPKYKHLTNIKKHRMLKIFYTDNFEIYCSIKVNRPYLWQYRNLSGCPNVKYENIEQKTSCGYLNATLKNSLPTMLHKVQTASIYCGSMLMIYQIKSDGVYSFWHPTIRIRRIQLLVI